MNGINSSGFLLLLDLVRVLAAGIALGLVVGRIVVRRPYHIERLRPRHWFSAMRKIKGKQWLKLIAAALAVAATSLLLSIALGSFLQQFEVQVVSPEDYPFVSMEREHPLLVLMAVNVLPIFEEWIFRGVIIDEMIRWHRSRFFAVIVSAVLFSAFHLSNPGTYPAIVVSMLPASLLLGICYLYTGLGGAIVAHSSYNTFLLVIGALTR